MTSPKRASVLTRELVLSLYMPALVLSLGQGIIAPALPVYAKSFNVGFGEAAMLFVAYQFGTLVATFPTGLMMDKIGRRPILLSGPLLTAASSLMMVFAGSYTELLVYRFIAGAAQEFWQQSRLAIIADSANTSSRGQQVASMVGLQRAGILFGPALGGFMAAVWDIRAPFLAYAALLLLIVLPTFLTVKETAPVKQPLPAQDGAGAAAAGIATPSFLKFLLSVQILTFFAVQIFSTMCRGAQDGTFNLYAVYAYGIGPDTLGWVSALAGVAALPIPFVTGYIMDRWGRRKVIIPSFSLLAAALVYVAATAHLHLDLSFYVLGYVLTQMAQSTTNGTMQVLGSDMAPPEARGKFFGIWRFTSQLAGLASPALFAFVAEKVSYGSAFLMIAVFSGGVSVLVFTFLKETVMTGESRPGPQPARV